MQILMKSEFFEIHLLIFFINILFLAFASRLVSLFNEHKSNHLQLSIFRSINIVFLILHLSDLSLQYLHQDYEHLFIKIGSMLCTIYFTIFAFNIVAFFTRKKFGEQKQIDEKAVFYDTYNSRLVNLIFSVILSVLAFYIIIKIWHFDALLETTGLFGLAAGFLALTNQIWAPDLYYGLVILNAKMLENGDVIQINNEPHEYIINKVTLTYTILLDVRNNHRTLIRNSKLVEAKLDNLSKKASADGLRLKLSYKIGYPNIESKEDIASFKNRIAKMFNEAFNKAITDCDSKIKANQGFEFQLAETGDFALEYHFFFYLNSLPKTKVTRRVREYLMRTPALMNQAIYETGLEYDIDLSTPVLLQHNKPNYFES